MTGSACIFLAASGVFAAADWYAVHRDIRLLEYVCKPATILALIGVAFTLEPQVDGRRIAIVVALLLCLAGDVFLMLRRERNGGLEKGMFVPGLASFFLAHIAYIVGFQIDGGHLWQVLLIFVIVRGATIPITVRLLSSMKDKGFTKLAPPVRAYAIAICGMVAAVSATGEPLAIAGAGLFLFSDFLIAWSRFVVPLTWAPLAIIVTYHVGQAGLVLSLA